MSTPVVRYESTLALPENLPWFVHMPVTVEHVIEKIREIAFPTLLDDGRIGIVWEAIDEWELRGMVEEVRQEVEAMLNAGLVWDRPTLIPGQQS